MRVRVGSKYRYEPVPIDRFHKVNSLVPGQIVKVINLRSAPKANTMNHCHVEDLDGRFMGMVCCNSLVKQ